ncbi:alpha-2,8-sialyltransferase 8F-like isoform X2 [Rhinoraja longicauda]
MIQKARYLVVLLAYLLCFCCLFWMRKEKANYVRFTRQERDHQQSPNSPECVELRKILTLKPNRFTEDHYIKLFKKIQKCRWIKNSEEHQKIRSQLEKCCNASRNFVVTQVNAPLGTKITYEAETKKTFAITQDTLELIPETDPFKNHILKRCSVIGNGGVLTNSSCGKEINKADFVFRCNIPPIMGYEDDVGIKTDVATLNPSILRKSCSR